MNLHDAAANLGMPVFPCGQDKAPLIAGWPKAATTDPAIINRMFSSSAAQMIGVPTGGASGWVVVDVDVKGGQPGMAWLDANAHRLPSTRTHRTRSGGLHLVFLAPLSTEIRNSAGRVAPGVDVRGEGGFVIVPPSPGYAVADATPPAEMPAWLVQACLKPEPTATPQTYSAAAQPPSDRYAAAALDGECNAVAQCGEGGRNDRLNVAAVKLGSLVAAGLLDRGTVETELTAAAHAAGLDPLETRKTIASGLAFGLQHPRQVPERQPRAEPLRMTQERVTGPEMGEVQPPAASKKHAANRLPLIGFDDVAPNLDAADFVEGLLIEGAMSVVYGPSNCGKTFFMTDLSLHVAAGWKWREREVEAGAVIYCALEGAHGISNRVAAFKAEHGIVGGLPFFIVPVTLNLRDPNGHQQILVDTIRDKAQEIGKPVRLVVVDTLSRALAGGNENAPDDMGAVVASADYVRQELGAHFCFIHHSGKDQAAGARGHSLLRAATDTEIEIGREGKDAPSVATVTKQRELEIDGTFVFKLKVVELGTNRRGKPVTSCVVEPMGAKDAPQQATRERLPPSGRAGMVALQEALAKHGQTGTHRDIPENVPVVPVETWRREFYARSTEETQEARKKAFQRATKALLDARAVAVLHDRAWVVRGEE